MTIQEVLKNFWGYDTFRYPQEDIINSVLLGKDTLALLPTGAGKSICYQVPILSNPGIGIVVSPLIALMKDQVQQLRRKGIKAIEIVSGMSAREIDIALDNCIYGDIKFLYLSPERLQNNLVQERIKKMKVNLLAVDEAHCISQWGYDFRPAYLNISAIREIIPNVPVLALTASATSEVVLDIQEKLQFKESNIFQISFERKNLNYLVIKEENKLRRLVKIISKVPGTALCYVRNRKQTEEIAKFLNQHGIRADYYHAGLNLLDRARKQDDWILNKTKIMVATNAFGMGIDKPDVRLVVHLDLPESLEAYYQEAGRAGRDGLKSFAVLLNQDSDIDELKKKSIDNFPEFEELEACYQKLYNYYKIAYGSGKNLCFEFNWLDFSHQHKISIPRLIQLIKFLEYNKLIYLSDEYKNDSRLTICVSPDNLYAFQIANAHFDILIKTLLRSYGGLFEQYIAVNLNDILKRSGINEVELNRQLKLLQEYKIIDFVKGSKAPLLTFLEDRLDSSNLMLNKKYWQSRKDVLTSKILAICDYAKLNICRSKQILGYFSELNYEVCGQCDVCISNKNTDNQLIVREKILKRILRESSKENLSLPLILKTWTDFPEELIKTCLQELIDEGRIQFNGKNGVIEKKH